MASENTITFFTGIDNSQLEKDLKQAEREVRDLEEKVSKWSGNKSSIEKQMESAEAAIKETEARIDELKAKMAGVPDNVTDPDAYFQSQQQVRQYETMIAEANGQLTEQVKHIDRLGNDWQKADEKQRTYSEGLARAKGRASEIGAEYGNAMNTVRTTTAAATEQSVGMFDKMANKINAKMKKLFVFSFVFGALASLKGHLVDTAKENERFAATFANLKATMSGFAAPVVNGIISVLTSLMNILTSMFMNLARLIDSVFRTDIAGSIKAARDAAKAAEREAKAKKKTAKAAKEAAKSIMAFDEINAMQADKNAESDADSGSAPLDWDALGAGKIDETLSAIMAVLGAALLAVGAILCFSGINIPLGITLMAIGALMIYTAIQENWGALPAEVQAAITGLLVISGVVLLALGCVLAFSNPATTAIGIGLMAAGAALLWSAVALNWDSMPQEMRTVVSVMMGIVSAALLVIGAILCLSGGGTPLGIGLMLVGAAGLAAAVALNWDSMPEEVQNVITAIMAVVGVAFLVLGAILALSGAAAPLGVGLMVVGAGALAAAAALNWEKMPQEIRNQVQSIMAIVGGALIVIGIILIATGVGIPLGIACILAGVGSLVAAAALNPDFFLDMVKDIWSGVTSFWDQHIAKIFTLQFWSDLWKSMVNGLIGCINSGLSAFGGFINSITSGISGLLSGLGVDWSWSVQMPQLPYLAQGAVIPPNRKFAAVLGDQSYGNNLEAPEGLIRQIVREEAGGNPQALGEAMQAAVAAALMQVLPMFQQRDGATEIVMKVGEEELGRVSANGISSLIGKGVIRPEVVFGL